MSQRSVLFPILLVLIIAIACAGCTTQQPAAVTPTATPTIVATTLLPTITTAPAVTEKAAEVTLRETRAETKKVILTTKGTISPGEYKIFTFKSMGDEFSKIGEKYVITLKADKPVIGYAVTQTQADELQGKELIPHYVASSEKIQWGLITPYMSLGKVTDSTETFTVENINPYVYVVDARWMASDNDFKNLSAFNYDLSITKIVTATSSQGPVVYT